MRLWTGPLHENNRYLIVASAFCSRHRQPSMQEGFPVPEVKMPPGFPISTVSLACKSTIWTCKFGFMFKVDKISACFALYSLIWEAGFAKGLDKEVIFTCRKDDLNNSHFDVKQINTKIYERHFWIKREVAKEIGVNKDLYIRKNYIDQSI